LIVGFPTETEEDFQETLALMDRIQYDSVYAFAYSPRPGTRAAKLPDDVPDEVKNERLNRLLQHQNKISQKRYASRIGHTLEVLVEGRAKNQIRGPQVYTGRSSCNRVVNFTWDSPRDITGQYLPVQITDATHLALFGEPQHEEAGLR
jgi:tRNA-2-methylthio-N6-dimethylallyladenosine synthase